MNYPDFITTTEYGTAGGLAGVNCRHSFFFVTESQKPNYTEEQLADMAKQEAETKEWKNQLGKTEKLTHYEQTQRMRRMENTMRKTRQRAATFKALNSTDDYIAQKAIYASQRAEYKRFCKTMGLKEQFDRVYLDGLGRI